MAPPITIEMMIMIIIISNTMEVDGVIYIGGVMSYVLTSSKACMTINSQMKEWKIYYI